MRTFAEQLEYNYEHDDKLLAELLIDRNASVDGLLEAVAYAYVNKDWSYLSRRIDGDIADEVAERQREHDDRMLASWDGTDPGR